MYPKTRTIRIQEFFFLFILISFPAVFLTGDAQLHAQAVSRGGERGSFILNWDGIWETTYGDMELAQDGTSITGRFGEDDELIVGDVDGRTLEFDWYEGVESAATPSGTGEFVLNSDNAGFTGWRMFSSGSERYDWFGTRKGDREISGHQADVEYCYWTGAWEIPGGMMVFDQKMDENSVTGEFYTPDLNGMFEGEASGWLLNIAWTSDSSSGTGNFTMSDSLGSFAGTLIPENSEFETAISGTFASFGLREDFSGLWETDWGMMELTQDMASGVVHGTAMDASIGGHAGNCTIDGTAIGPMLVMSWTLHTPQGNYNGIANLETDSANTRLTGKWSSTDLGLADEKFRGTRR
jgi:hypothetical protein